MQIKQPLTDSAGESAGALRESVHRAAIVRSRRIVHDLPQQAKQQTNAVLKMRFELSRLLGNEFSVSAIALRIAALSRTKTTATIQDSEGFT